MHKLTVKTDYFSLCLCDSAVKKCRFCTFSQSVKCVNFCVMYSSNSNFLVSENGQQSRSETDKDAFFFKTYFLCHYDIIKHFFC